MVTIVGVITGDQPRQIRQFGIFAGNISFLVFIFSPFEFYLKLWALPSLIRLLSGSLGPQDGNILKMLMINLRWEERKKEIKRRALCVFPPVLSSLLVGSYLTRRGSALLSLFLSAAPIMSVWQDSAGDSRLVLLTSPTSAQLIIMIVTLWDTLLSLSLPSS